MTNFRRVLITGAGGFVGAHLWPALTTVLPDATFRLTTFPKHARVELPWVGMDIADRDGVDEVLAEWPPDLVVHLAAQSSVGTSADIAAATWATNVGGAIALAAGIARHAPTATVFNVSTSEVYGRSFLEGPAREDTELRPTSVYGHSKAAAELAFADILPATVRLITVRPFNHTGPGQDDRFVVPAFAKQIAQILQGTQAPPIRVGNLEAERDFLDVRDVVRAYAMLIARVRELPMRTTFNIASGTAVRIGDVLTSLLAIVDREIPVESDPSRQRASDIPRACGDSSAVAAAVGWRPIIGLTQTLRDVLDEMNQQM